MNSRSGNTNFRAAVRIYHSFPLIALLTIILVYLGMFFTTESTVLAVVVSAIPAVVLLWFWVHAARQIRRWLCDKCGQPFPKKMSWTFPPKSCPNCGKPIS